jgi:predicted glycoside hydrolase/deacetylase ChbG (UPF0249 family)
MIILNADDLGRSRSETEAALSCHARGRITAATAMVFMVDSERAADVARRTGLDVGLHFNLDEAFTAPGVHPALRRQHEFIARFLKGKRYSLLIYHPLLRQKFRSLYLAQENEFIRLYGEPPSHVDSHHHLHLCANMLIDRVIPRGYQVRRSFTFQRGERGRLNRAYRYLLDKRLQRRYRLTDCFFSLRHCLEGETLGRIVELSRTAKVELVTHPQDAREYDFLMGNRFDEMFSGVELGDFSQR